MIELRTTSRVAYAATAWLGLFVVAHLVFLVWPGGAPAGDGPWGATAYVVYNIVLIAIAAVGALLVLATVRPWGAAIPRRIVAVPLYFGSGLLVVRGVPGLVEDVLMLSGVRRGGFVGDQNISGGEFWTGIGINAYFFAGAVTLVAATRVFVRRDSRRCVGDQR